MTELLEGALEVRVEGGRLKAVRTGNGWCSVVETALTWRVETDWWRSPVRRDYLRCLLDNEDCIDVYQDLETGAWHWARRYD